MTGGDLPAPGASTVDPNRFRAAMRAVPTTVAVVSALVEDGPVGMVVGTFTSVSLEPPLVGFLGDRRSRTAAALAEVPAWSVALLHADQAALVEAFSGPVERRFDGIAWYVSDGGAVRIPGAVVTVDTVQYGVVRAGDHDLMLGRVTALEGIELDRRPLVYFQGRLTRLDSTHGVDVGHWQLGWD